MYVARVVNRDDHLKRPTGGAVSADARCDQTTHYAYRGACELAVESVTQTLISRGTLG